MLINGLKDGAACLILSHSAKFWTVHQAKSLHLEKIKKSTHLKSTLSISLLEWKLANKYSIFFVLLTRGPGIMKDAKLKYINFTIIEGFAS